MMRQLLTTCVLCLALVGCIATGVKVDETQLAQFERGRTTYFDVVATLGKPTQATLYADGTREVSYTYTQSQLRAVNFIPVLAMFAQGRDSESTTVTLAFDARSVLTSYVASQGQQKIGTGITSGGKQ